MKKKIAIGLSLLVTVCGMAVAMPSTWKCASCGNYVLMGPDYVEPTYYKNRTYHSGCVDRARQADERLKLIQEQRARKQAEAKEKAEREAKEAEEREERQRQKENEREYEKIRKQYPGLFLESDFLTD